MFGPDTLASALDGLRVGDLRPFALFAEEIAKRDNMLSIVKPKREKALARRGWQIVEDDTADESTAKRHADILRRFYLNIRAVNAYDRNDRGGWSKLVRQMLTAVSFQYAAHRVRWMPQANGELRAELEFVPLWFMENRSGTLRFCPNGTEVTGHPVHILGDAPPDEAKEEHGQWLVTVGDGLMIACAIGYLLKRGGLADWSIFCERVAIPGTIGHTPHAEDSDAGRAMAAAVAAYNADARAVIYEQEGPAKIETVAVNGNVAATHPAAALIEQINRSFAAAYRGADLSTISSSSGQGTGASLQEAEQILLEMDDALTIEEALENLSLEVLRYYEGPDVQPAAWLEIIVPRPEDQNALVTAMESLVKHGAEISAEEMMNRLGFKRAKEGAQLLSPPLDYQSAYSMQATGIADARTGLDAHNQRQQQEAAGTVTTTNARTDEREAARADFLAACTDLLTDAAQQDRAELALRLRAVLAADDAALPAAMRDFLERMPDQITADSAQAAAWERILATASLLGWTLGTPEPEPTPAA